MTVWVEVEQGTLWQEHRYREPWNLVPLAVWSGQLSDAFRDPSVHCPIYFSFCGEDSIAGPSGDLVGMPGGME